MACVHTGVKRQLWKQMNFWNIVYHCHWNLGRHMLYAAKYMPILKMWSKLWISFKCVVLIPAKKKKREGEERWEMMTSSWPSSCFSFFIHSLPPCDSYHICLNTLFVFLPYWREWLGWLRILWKLPYQQWEVTSADQHLVHKFKS